jgi:hypothetical protein
MRQVDQVGMFVVKFSPAQFAALQLAFLLACKITQRLESAGCFVSVRCRHDPKPIDA